MNTHDILKYGHQTLTQTIEGLPLEAWQAPGVCGIWSVKDIIAHLASYEQVLVEVLLELTGGQGPTPTLNDFRQAFATFNDTEVEKRQALSGREVWAEYAAAHAKTLALIGEIPVAVRRQNGTLPWYGPAYDLDDFIVYTYYGHKREHSAQIAVYRDHLEHRETYEPGLTP
ncbi:MAG TPA: maleylpyruvate isomerase N-terminal domain-containing protein [Anaerolineae bacterium]|nr:maleylpyruvate isomerase N-terminal domain-containing protein [Anaerolineae bacterium]